MSVENPKRVERPLKSGDAGVNDTVHDAIIRLARRDAKSADVKALAKKLKEDSDIETIYAVYTYVWKKFPYINDPAGEEHVTAPALALNGKAEYMDCDDLTTLLLSLLLALGYECAIIVISWDRERCDGSFCPFTHVFLMVDCPGTDGYIPLDPVKKEKGFGFAYAPIIRRKLYEV